MRIATNWGDSVHHDGSTRYVRTGRSGEPRFGDEVTIRMRAHADAPIQRVLLRTCPDGEQHFVEMGTEIRGEAGAQIIRQPHSGTSRTTNWWQATVRMTMPVVAYRFLLFGDDGGLVV